MRILSQLTESCDEGAAYNLCPSGELINVETGSPDRLYTDADGRDFFRLGSSKAPRMQRAVAILFSGILDTCDIVFHGDHHYSLSAFPVQDRGLTPDQIKADIDLYQLLTVDWDRSPKNQIVEDGGYAIFDLEQAKFYINSQGIFLRILDQLGLPEYTNEGLCRMLARLDLICSRYVGEEGKNLFIDIFFETFKGHYNSYIKDPRKSEKERFLDLINEYYEVFCGRVTSVFLIVEKTLLTKGCRHDFTSRIVNI